MFELRQITLIGWYLFDAEQIDVRGQVAIVGPNGSGKTSLVDAIQVALLGARRNADLNASAQTGTRSKRSIRSYCLGAYAVDENEHPRFSRENTLSYVVLGFRHSVHGQEASVGVCLRASQSTPEEKLVSAFVAEGRMLGRADLVQEISAGWEPVPWESIRRRLSAEADLVLHETTSPDRHVEQMLISLNPEHRPNYQQFIRNFRNAVGFRPVENPSQFVRSYILEESRIDFADLRKELGLYKAIVTKVEDLKKRLAYLKGLEDRFRRYDEQRAEEQARLAYERWLLLHDAGLRRRLSLERYQTETQSRRMHANTATAEKRRLDTLRDELQKIEDKLNATGVEAQIREINAQVTLARSKLAEPDRLLDGWRAEIRRVAGAMGHAPADRLDTAAQAWIADAHLVLARTGEVEAYGLMERWSRLSDELEPSFRRLEEFEAELLVRQGELDQEIRSHQRNLERLASGKALLHQHVDGLLELLEAKGIPSVPLCTVCAPAPGLEPWQRAAEGWLGLRRQTLIVPAEHTQEAIRIYRGARKLNRAMVINGPRVRAEGRSARPNTLATALHTADPIARAYLDDQLGNVMMVETEEALLDEKLAVTRDLMTMSGFAVGKMDFEQEMLLAGQQEVEKNRIRLESAIAAAQAEKERRETDLRQLRQLILLPFRLAVQTMNGFSRSAHLAWQDRMSVQGEIERLQAERAAAEARQDLDLIQRRATERQAVDQAERDWQEAVRKAGEKQGLVKSLRTEHRNIRANWLSRRVELGPEPDGPVGERHRMFVIALENHPGKQDPATVKQMIEDNAELYRNARRNAGQLEDMIKDEFNNFFRVFPGAAPFGAVDGTGRIRFWMGDTIGTIEANELVAYQERAEEAHRKVMDTLKGKVANRLHGAMGDIEKRLGDLNRLLRRRTFHNGDSYRFRKKPNSRYTDFVDLAEKAGSPDFDLPLFVQAADPDSPAARAAAFIHRLIELDDMEIEEYEDPRKFFEYELLMLDRDGLVKGTMSSRLALGSGGENQVPFYVTIGASLSAMYHTKNAERGVAVSLFDEAFAKLDPKAIAEVCGFLRDLELQTLVAAPNEKVHIFLGEFDTVVTLTRIGEEVDVAVEYTKPKLRETLAREDPGRLGIEAFRMPASGEPQAGHEDAA